MGELLHLVHHKESTRDSGIMCKILENYAQHFWGSCT